MEVQRNSAQAMTRLLPKGVRARAFMFAALAAAAPLAALTYASLASLTPAFAGAALAFTLIALMGLARTLRPIAALAAELDRQAQGAVGAAVPDDQRRLMANLETMTARMEALNARVSRHAVTGLPMREELLGAMAQELAFATTPAVLGLVRVANFSHLLAFDPGAAERMLAVLARRASDAMGADRPVAQVDRDCFAVWFGVGVEPKAAAAQLETLSYLLAREVQDQKFAISPDIQLGSALYPVDADEPASLLNRAFVSLARPQRTAEGGLAFFAKPSAKQARRRFFLEQDLRHAVRRGELALHYQPFVDLAMCRVVGAEALLRWESPHHTVSSPAQIVPVLEETGLVHEFGLWALNAACRQVRGWRELGQDLKVAVNLSVRQLRDSSLPSAFKQIVASHGLATSQIELELTETAAMEDAAGTLAMFEQLREAGFSLAIDDFGSGYSSLSYLRRLPFQKLKIDREFVSHVDERADSRSICRALIDLTAGLELSVLAEGVERHEEIETLHTLGCSTFQGYYFSRPLAPANFIAAVTDPEWLARLSSPARRRQDELKRRLS